MYRIYSPIVLMLGAIALAGCNTILWEHQREDAFKGCPQHGWMEKGCADWEFDEPVWPEPSSE